MLVAEICANMAAKNINETYTYAVPEKLKFLSAGWRVIIPFGGQKIDGFVISVRETDETFNFALKEIIDAVDSEAWFTPEMLKLSQWLADFYLCPLAQAMALFMPGSRSKKIQPKFERVIKLIGDFEEKNFTRSPTQLKILKALRECGELPASKIKNSAAIKILAEKNLVAVENRRILRDSYADFKSAAREIALTPEQNAAVENVKPALILKCFQGYLLHGVTGSGKTQVYIELTKIVRQSGRRAVILVPEIALTGQIVQNFKAHFPDVFVIHSKLSVEERSDTFYKIRNGDAGVVIGARSALFTPIENVGLIVVDEEHDHSYKQESPPHYHARIVAEEFAKFHNAAIVFGSATPSLENYHRAKIGELRYLEMPRRIFYQPLPEIEIVDMRAELEGGNKSVLSGALRNLLAETLTNQRQAIILLNRRGYSTFVLCRNCGAVVKCPHCDKTMTYHLRENVLKCHTCAIERETPRFCPKCGSSKIKFLGTGTEKLEEALHAEFPAARLLRMDSDTTAKKFAHERILAAFRRGDFDILFGTQMVAKGHDVEKVSAVGILNADSVLFFPDFRSAEQCFDLIVQAAGRAGRADFSGKVVVQAYNANAETIQLACRQDYKTFAENELLKREFGFFPPFSRLVKLIFTGKKAEYARDFAERIVATFKQENSGARQEIFGPIAAKAGGELKFAVLIKSADLEMTRGFLRFYNLHKSPDVQIDFDPTYTD